ncbi:MAG: uroporphyrinogen decarboxylase [Bacteroidetes bacterium]|nr:uroporphyrinogen decarboxylase [Bacteroidota bacterium]
MNWINWVGYLAAGLVVLSFLVGSNIRTIRSVNLLGAIMFVVYGFLLNTNLPIIIPNVFITCIQSYYLFIRKEKTVA